MAVITLFRISGASQVYFDSFKGCYQHGYYCRECLYSQISLKVWDSMTAKKNWHFHQDWRYIAQLGIFSVDPGIVVSFYSSAHPHTTMSEWYFDPAKLVPLKLDPQSVAPSWNPIIPTCKVATSKLTINRDQKGGVSTPDCMHGCFKMYDLCQCGLLLWTSSTVAIYCSSNHYYTY